MPTHFSSTGNPGHGRHGPVAFQGEALLAVTRSSPWQVTVVTWHLPVLSGACLWFAGLFLSARAPGWGVGVDTDVNKHSDRSRTARR